MKNFLSFLNEQNSDREAKQDEYFDILEKNQHPETGHFRGDQKSLTRLGEIYNEHLDSPGGHVSDHFKMAIDSPHNTPEHFYGLHGTSLNVALTSPRMPVETGEYILDFYRAAKTGKESHSNPAALFAKDSSGQFIHPEIHFLNNPNHTPKSFAKQLNFLLSNAIKPVPSIGYYGYGFSDSSIPHKQRADYQLINSIINKDPQMNKFVPRDHEDGNHMMRMRGVTNYLRGRYEREADAWGGIQVSEMKIRDIFNNADKETQNRDSQPLGWDDSQLDDLYDWGGQ